MIKNKMINEKIIKLKDGIDEIQDSLKYYDYAYLTDLVEELEKSILEKDLIEYTLQKVEDEKNKESFKVLKKRYESEDVIDALRYGIARYGIANNSGCETKEFRLKKLKEVRDYNHTIWFERWVKKYDLDKQIWIENLKGNSRLELNISIISLIDDEKKNQLRNEKMLKKEYTIELLKKRYPDFKIYKTKYEEAGLFRNYTMHYIVIDWGVENE